MTAPARRDVGDGIVVALIVVGFFLGPLKLMGGSWVAYLLPDALASAAILLHAGRRIRGGEPVFAPSPLTTPLLLLGGYCALQLFNPESPIIRSVLGLRSWLLYLGLYFVGLDRARSATELRRVTALLLGLGVVTAVLGLAQWTLGPEAFAGWSEYYQRYARLAWDTGTQLVFRAFSTFVSPGVFASNMALLMGLALAAVIADSVSRRWRLLALAAFGVMGAGILISGSRAPVLHLALMIALLWLVLPDARARLRVGVATGLVVAAAVAGLMIVVGSALAPRFAPLLDVRYIATTAWGRLASAGSNAWLHPLGHGLGYTAGVPSFVDDPMFRTLPTTNMDSGYGAAALELGLPGLALYAYLAIKIGLAGTRAWKALPVGPTKDLLLGPALWAAAYPIMAILSPPQASLPSSIYFWLMMGMLLRGDAAHRPRPDADRVFRPPLPARQ